MKESELTDALQLARDEFTTLLEFIQNCDVSPTEPTSADTLPEWFQDNYGPTEEMRRLFAQLPDYLANIWTNYSEHDRGLGIAQLCRYLRAGESSQSDDASDQTSEAEETISTNTAAPVPIQAGVGFTADEERAVLNAQELAAESAERAISRIRKEIQEESGFGTRWFGTQWEQRSDHIIKIYRDIKENASSVPVVRYGSGGTTKMTSDAAGGHSFLYTEPGECIYTFDAFWTLPSTDQGLYFLHELSHWVDRHILDYSDMDLDNALKLLKDGGTPYAVYNAYSYHYCAQAAYSFDI